MHPPAILIYGGISLAGFGVAYDSGLFGVPDGYDHSAVVLIAGSTGTVAPAGGQIVSYTPNTITGDDIAMPRPPGPGFGILR